MKPLSIALALLALCGCGRPAAPEWHKAALHVHTTASDGLYDDDTMIAAYAAQGFDIVAITDHDRWYSGQTGIRNIGVRTVLVLEGIEHTEGRAHVVEVAGVRIVAHPALGNMSMADFDRIEAECYEVWNTTCNYPLPGKPKCAHAPQYDGRGKRAVAVDDAHTTNIIGQGYTMIQCELTPASVAAALRAGDIEAVFEKEE